MTTYPSGYGSTLLPLDDLFARNEGDKMHPEYRRRLSAALVEADGLVGIGGAWRSTERQRVLFLERHVQVSSGGCCSYDGKRWALRPGAAHAAPPGSSFHESQTFASGVDGFQAVDMVGRDGRHNEAWAWMRANAARFGLVTFWNVGSEPWHVQCFDLPNSVSKWKAAGRPDPDPTFRLPGAPVSPPEVNPPPAEEDDMSRVNGVIIRMKGTADHWLCFPLSGDTKSRLAPDEPTPIVVDGDRAEFARRAGYPLTPLSGE